MTGRGDPPPFLKEKYMLEGVGTWIVAAILIVIVFFALRRTIRDVRAKLKGQGCSCCGGCDGNCASCMTSAACGSNQKTEGKKP